VIAFDLFCDLGKARKHATQKSADSVKNAKTPYHHTVTEPLLFAIQLTTPLMLGCLNYRSCRHDDDGTSTRSSRPIAKQTPAASLKGA
jgi:hypothetical protein